jgi:hypothetical protein
MGARRPMSHSNPQGTEIVQMKRFTKRISATLVYVLAALPFNPH